MCVKNVNKLLDSMIILVLLVLIRVIAICFSELKKQFLEKLNHISHIELNVIPFTIP